MNHDAADHDAGQSAADDAPKDAPDGERLADEVRELQRTDADGDTGRGEPGDGSAGATGPGGSSS